MVIREGLGQEEGASGSGGRSLAHTAEGLGGRGPQLQEDAQIAGFQKCPYLAGRPPCGTHHMFPSGANVCYACPGSGKPYRSQSRETQELHCFSGAEGLAGCEHYQRAVAEALPLPRFELPRADKPTSQPRITPPARCPSHGREEKPGARLMFYLSWLAPLLLSFVLMAMYLR